MRVENIIADAEADYGVELDPNFEITLCDGDTCRHDECSCWDELDARVREELEADRNRKLLGQYGVLMSGA